MVSYSTFQHEWTKSQYFCDVPRSQDYKVYLNGEEIPVYTCRISKYPLNTWWPGHQRPVNQTEIVSYVNLVCDEEIELEIEPLIKTKYDKIIVKPYSKGVKAQKKANKISLSLKENGAYAFALDNYHSLLYVFNNKPVPCENRNTVTHYFGKGVHFPGKIKLRSNESIYVDKDAYVFGCVFAENAENIRIYGNGVFDDSGEERFSEHCYEPYTNGNLKFYDCKNVTVQGVGLTNSAIWCVNLFHCFDVEINAVNVFGQWRYNTDGIDIVNSQRITVRNSFVHSFDDTVAIKGIDCYAFENNADIRIENCVLWCDWGKTCEIGLETNCMEYRNIVFRNCDILRGGNTACDIQNGDCAEVHDVVFENIRLELETFYTPPVYQATQSMGYEPINEQDHSALLCIGNPRFRDYYQFLGADKGSPYPREIGEKQFASAHHITVKDIHLYCDESYFEKRPKNAVAYISIGNGIASTEFANISVTNVTLNGKRLTGEEMQIDVSDNVKDFTVE